MPRSTAVPKNRIAELEAQANGGKKESVVITPPNMQTAIVRIVGETPLVMHAFSQKAREQMRAKQESGERAKKGQKRAPRDFDANYEASKHLSTEGWLGFPAGAFRNAFISACRVAGFAMTRAKLAVFVEADGYEANGTPLVRFTKGAPHYHETFARNDDGGMDLRARAMLDPGWEMTLRIRYDADQFSISDIANLVLRAGSQVGVGDGRPDSPRSAGMGWGTFTIKED